MNRKSQPPTNAKTSSSKRPTPSYAQSAGSNAARSASPSSSDKANTTAPPAAAKPSFSAAAKQARQRTPDNAANDTSAQTANARGNGAGRNAPVRLPRNSVSSSGAPAIQFGSLNQQTRPASPPAAHRPSATAATSGGVPATIGKSTPKPNFGSIPSTEDTGRRPNSSSGAPDARHSHHGRQQSQNAQQNHGRLGSRASGHERQSQGFTPGRKDSNSYKSSQQQQHQQQPQHGNVPKSGAKPHEGGEAAFHAHAENSYASGHPATVQMPSGPPQTHPGAQQPHYAGSPYRGQGPPHVRPQHSHSPNPYKPQAGAHYAPHHMGSQPMGYPMPSAVQSMQPQIMTTQPNMAPMQGWMPPQFAYMPMAGPGYEQYYRSPQTGGGPPPHNMYSMQAYSMPNPTHAASSQIGAGGIMPMSGAHMPGMTASPMPGQQPQHGLSAHAQTFVPSRRAVRIVNPNTNEEVDVSQQRVRSTSAASSTPRNVASGTASPAPGSVADGAGVSAEDTKPTFKIPSSRVIKIVNPNLVAKPEAEESTPAPAISVTVEEEKEPSDTNTVVKDNTGPAPMDVDEKEAQPESVAEPVAEVISEAVAEPVAPAESAKEPVAEAEAAVESAEEPVVEEAKPIAKDTTPPVKEVAPAVEEAKAAPVVEETKAAEVPAEQSEVKADETTEAKVETPAVDELTESLAKATIAEKAEPVKEAETVEEPEPVKDTEVAQTNDKQIVDDDEKAASEDGEIADDASDINPPSLGQSRSRQVTFSEPTSPAQRVLEKSEVLSLYANESAGPKIVEEILRYPRVFLERFNGLCRPPQSFHFEITSTDDRWASDRNSGMRRSASGSGSARHRESAASAGFGGMGNFRTNHSHAPLGSSEERFKQGSMDFKGRTDGGRGSMMGGRSASGRGLGGNRESRGGRSGGRGRGRGRGGRGGMAGVSDRQAAADAIVMANVKPLEKGENRYVAKSLRTDKDAVEDDMAEEVFDRQIRVLLNKITPDNFDTVSQELVGWGEKSAKETDGRILRHLITLVFQKATDEPVWGKMYARLCHSMICRTSNEVQDHALLTKDGGFLSGGYLVRKYLLTKCQEEFERGWKVEIPKDMESAEYYEATKIKRRGLGLVQFIGELFQFDVLTLRIMHECVKRLLSNVETPEEEETESLSKLLTTVGKKLDEPSAKAYMDAYFARILTMSNNKYLPSRIRFMLKDLIELRQKNWVVRIPETGPKTIAEIHDDVERKKAAEAAMRRAPSHPGRRSDSHAGRGEGRNARGGWNTVGGPSGSGRADQNQRAGDLSHFGNLSRSKQQPVGGGMPGNPFGAFAAGSRGWRNGSSDGRKPRDDRARAAPLSAGGRTVSQASRADSSAATPEPVGTRNMFDALMNEDDDSHARTDGARDASQAKADTASAAASQLDSATIQRKVRGIVDEYMNLNSDTELIECFKELGAVNYQGAVYEIANYIVDRREDQAVKIAQAVSVLRANSLLSEDETVAGLAEYSEQLEDMALDAPNAFKFFGILAAAAQVPLDRIGETLGELATKVDSPRPPALNVIFAYLKQLIKDGGEEATKDSIEKAGFDVSQFMNSERRADADVKKALDFQDLLSVFSKYA